MNSLKTVIYISLASFGYVLFLSCINPHNNRNLSKSKEGYAISSKNNLQKIATVDTSKRFKTAYKVTFIELGSVRCIPCRQMQSVMKSIEEKYADQVKVVFHDVWTPEGKPFGKKYGIEAIPTQVFLDENGKEYYRHLGYFPEEELVKILNMKGVK